MPGVVKRRIGISEVTSDIYAEPMKLTIYLILLEGIEDTCSHPQLPPVGGHSGQDSSYGVDRQREAE